MKPRLNLALGAAALAVLAANPAAAATVKAQMALAAASRPGAGVGTVTFRDTPNGALIQVSLHGLPPGQHGFHVHVNPSCEPGPVNGTLSPAGGAGGHYDPAMTGAHMGPEGNGHLGDLPFLTVASDGTDRETLTAPRIKDVGQLKRHSVMIHAGGDNYADQPKPLGGGGARIACGVVK